MCGRAANSLAPEAILKLLGLQQTSWKDMEKYQPSYNVSPGKYQPVLLASPSGNGHSLVSMKWGFVPSWSDGSSKKPINARSESLTSKPMFKKPVKSQRCVVFVEGFVGLTQFAHLRYYEWTESPKQAHYVKPTTHKVMMLAALYDRWVDKPTGEILHTYTVITTESAPQLTWLHDRMPVILTEETMETWLAATDVKEALSVLCPFDGDLEAYPVSNDVGKVANDSEYLTHKIEIKQSRDIRSFFTKREGLEPTSIPSSPVKTEKVSNNQDIRNFFRKESKKKTEVKESTEVIALDSTEEDTIKTEPEEVKQEASRSFSQTKRLREEEANEGLAKKKAKGTVRQ